MGDTGLEPLDVTNNKISRLQQVPFKSGAESGALGAQFDLSALSDPELGYIVNQWPLLPKSVQRDVLGIIRGADWL